MKQNRTVSQHLAYATIESASIGKGFTANKAKRTKSIIPDRLLFS